MHDIKTIKDDPQGFDAALKKRGLPPIAETILLADEALRTATERLQSKQTERNDIAQKMAEARRKGVSAEALVAAGAGLKAELPRLEEDVRIKKQAVYDILCQLPNTVLEDTPKGMGESKNVCVAEVGVIPRLSFEPKQHFELGESLGLMDFEGAAHLSGSRFVLLKGALAALERALAQFMIDVHTQEFGYELVSPPLLVKDPALFGTGQLPKFADDAFQTTNGHWLIPTSEVPLTGLVADQILDESALPLRYTAHTACFRSEAGSAGKDTRGMLRQHQFYKVELVSIVAPEDGISEFDRMVRAARSILDKLQLPYRVMHLCSGDMGFSAQKTYDLEVWLPGQKAYREISSCSYCGDFQARRMNARVRLKDMKKPHFVHTLNGSGIAVGRALIAVMENYQQQDGSIKLPDVLVPYMNGLSEVRK